MNITPQAFNAPIQTAVNLQTDSLRRENQQREVIAKPEAANQSAGEKGVASDKERGRTPAQNNEQVDFANLRKQAEQASESISGGTGGNEGSAQDSQQDASQDPSNENNEQNNTGSESVDDQDTAITEQQANAEAFAEKQVIRNLEIRDKEVRTHEMAHAAVGGAYTGSPSYSYEIGPDGKKYAVEGEVAVDLTPIAVDPKETIAKMKKVQAAALAPASPSAQDTRVAASAASIIAEAQAELIALNSEDAEVKPTAGNLYRDKEVLAQDDDSFENNESSKAFDRQIQQTLSSQDAIVPSRSTAVDERAGRIEQFYSTINQAYEKPPSFQFELIA